MMRSAHSPGAVIERWLRARSAAPVITWYGSDGSRVELSGATAANAVAKGTNLFADELLLDPGDIVWLDLPRHWQTPMIALAAWAAGLEIAIGPTPPPGAAATVATGEQDRGAGVRLAVSLHPFGLPLGPATPAGWEDYAAAARAQPDAATLQWREATDPWLAVGEDRLSGSALSDRADALAADWSLAEGGGLLTDLVPETVAGLLAMTLVPARRGGSAVLAEGDRDAILRQEGNLALARGV